MTVLELDQLSKLCKEAVPVCLEKCLGNGAVRGWISSVQLEIFEVGISTHLASSPLLPILWVNSRGGLMAGGIHNSDAVFRAIPAALLALAIARCTLWLAMLIHNRVCWTAVQMTGYTHRLIGEITP